MSDDYALGFKHGCALDKRIRMLEMAQSALCCNCSRGPSAEETVEYANTLLAFIDEVPAERGT